MKSELFALICLIGDEKIDWLYACGMVKRVKASFVSFLNTFIPLQIVPGLPLWIQIRSSGWECFRSLMYSCYPQRKQTRPVLKYRLSRTLRNIGRSVAASVQRIVMEIRLVKPPELVHKTMQPALRETPQCMLPLLLLCWSWFLFFIKCIIYKRGVCQLFFISECLNTVIIQMEL